MSLVGLQSVIVAFPAQNQLLFIHILVCACIQHFYKHKNVETKHSVAMYGTSSSNSMSHKLYMVRKE